MQARTSERYIVDADVHCTFREERVAAFAYNLSLDGCMIDIPDLCLVSGDPISVSFLGDLSQAGKVVWSQAGYIGIRFDKPLHVAVLRHLSLSPLQMSIGDVPPMDRFGRILPGLVDF